MVEQPHTAEIAVDGGAPRRCRNGPGNTLFGEIGDELARARPQRNFALQRRLDDLVVRRAEGRHGEARPVVRLDHGVALLAGHADHRMREHLGHDAVDRESGLEQAIEVDALGVEQQAVHVEDDRLRRGG